MIVKYKVSDFAKDLNLFCKEGAGRTGRYGQHRQEEQLQSGGEQLNYLLEKFSKDNSVANLDEFLNSAKAPKEEPKLRRRPRRRLKRSPRLPRLTKSPSSPPQRPSSPR